MVEEAVTVMTPQELRAFRNRWDKALARPGAVRVLTPLPWRVRARLSATSAVDRAATWLVYHVHWRAGALVWQLTGQWWRA